MKVVVYPRKPALLTGCVDRLEKRQFVPLALKKRSEVSEGEKLGSMICADPRGHAVLSHDYLVLFNLGQVIGV